MLSKSVLTNLHTTGHASKEEQKLMLQLIKPHYFMPIHGEYKMLMQHRQTAIDTGMPPENIFVCANGDILILRNHELLQSDWRYQGDDIYVDGNDISGLSTAVLKDRRILADNGLVAVIIAIDSKETRSSPDRSSFRAASSLSKTARRSSRKPNLSSARLCRKK